MTIGIIGTGMMGGSFAWLISEKRPGWNIIGYDLNKENAAKALEVGFIDEAVELAELVKRADLIIITIPVSYIVSLLPGILDAINGKQVVMDIGSTKELIVDAVKDHPKRSRFVATHPMW